MPPLSGKKPHEMKTTKWSMVYWLTEGRTRESFDACIQNMPQDWAIEGQPEKGKSSDDKEHMQMFLKTPQCRGTRIQKFFPGATFDEARNQFALQNYVHKEETRIGEFKTVENRSPQWHVVRDKFYEWYVTNHAEQLSFRVDDEEKLKYWDQFIGLSLEDGMNVDVIGVNPQYRSCIMRYWTNMIRRQMSRQDNPAEGGAAANGKDAAAEGVPRVKKLVKAFLPKE